MTSEKAGRKGWVPVALSASIEPGTSAGAVIDGAEIVVWRDDKGRAHVWEDRCPHRGMRMSFGFVRGDHIACLYHGWAYDTAGQCRYIPAHPDLDVPKTIKIPTYATEERNGLIWTALTEEAGSAAIPDPGAASLPVRSLYADCPPERALAVLRAARLPVADGGPVAATLETLADTCWTLAAGSTRLAIAVQSVGPEKIALHIVTDEAAAGLRSAIARWAEALRIALETPTAAVYSEVA